MAGTNKLSARFVQTVKEAKRHGDGQGLWLHVDPSGAKRWVFVFQWNKARAEMGMGSASDVSLAEAREKRDAARRLVAAGKNPIEERRRTEVEAVAAAEAVRTFESVLDEVLVVKSGGWKSAKHAKQWRSTLETHAGTMLKLPIENIDTDAVLKVLRPIWNRIQETASRVRGRIETVLDYAIAMKYRDGPNPAVWRGHLKLLLSERKKLARGHHKAMPYDEAPAFMVALAERQSMAARCLEFTILTWVRESEALEAKLPEIDLDKAVWTIPEERMKAGKEHVVPLSPRAVEILRDRIELAPDPEGYVFPGQKRGRPMSNMAMDMLLRRMKQPVTVHGFRSTAKDWASDKTNFPDEVSEEALAHQVGSSTRRAYRRSEAVEKRRRLLEAWAGYLYRVPGSNVARIRGG